MVGGRPFGRRALAAGGALRSIAAASTLHIRDLSWSRSIDPNVHAEAVTDFSGQLTGVEAGGGWAAFMGKDGYTEGRVDYVRERFLGVDFDRWNVRGFAAASPTPTTNFFLDWELGPTPNYNVESAAETYLGFAWQPSAGATVSLFDRASVDYTFVYYRFGREAFSGAEFEGTLNRLKLTVNISPPVSIRLIEQYNAFEDTLDSSLLLGWQKNYATAVWLGGQESRNVETGEAEHGVVGKVSVLFRN